MSEELEELSKELINLLKERGELTADDISRWGEEKGLLVFTLYVIVSEISELDYIEASPERVVIDETFKVDIPRWLRYRGLEKAGTEEKGGGPGEEKARDRASKPSGLQAFLKSGSRKAAEVKARPPRRARQRRRQQKDMGGDILSFLTQAGAKGEEDETSLEKTGEEGVEEKAPQHNEKITMESNALLSEIRDLLEKPEYEKALRYLSTYWSVGLLRFYRDMEKSGVKNPREVLKVLYQRGLIEIAELEVINAKPELRALKNDLRKKIKLSEVFGRS